jgi:lycopene cyclase domain-containing protein
VKEYSLLVLVSVAGVIAADRFLTVRLLGRKEFWIFIAVMTGFMLLTNGYLTSRPVVLYGDAFFMNLKLGTIPIEDFFYGFSLVSLTIIFWEYFKRKEHTKKME